MRSRWLAPVVVLAMWAFALAVLGELPERVPTHWNLEGEVDGWSSRVVGAFVGPALATGLLLLAQLLPRIDPRGAHFRRFAGEWRLIVNLIVLFMAVAEAATLGYALGWPIEVDSVVLGATGVLFIGLGNYLPRVRSNWFVGIRTPWTLSSERVWRDTHRIGGRVFVVGGAVATLAAFLPGPARGWVAVSAFVVAALIPVVYSYFAWRREAA